MSTYLPGVQADPKPGGYRAAIEAAKARGEDYSRIWDLFAFQHDTTVHLQRFSQGVLRQPASISEGFRELIAAYTSYQNECGFCTKAHAAAAAELLGSEELVWDALRDVDHASVPDKQKTMLKFVGTLTLRPATITAADVDALRSAGWDDEAIYYAVTTCALFNFYNRWIFGTGVPEMSAEAHREQGRGIATRGYTRG